jgi:carboxyl-terminal processing protease
VKEVDLSKHLENGNGTKEAKKTETPKAEEQSLAVSDYQLYEALNLLKGLTLLKDAGPKG